MNNFRHRSAWFALAVAIAAGLGLAFAATSDAKAPALPTSPQDAVAEWQVIPLQSVEPPHVGAPTAILLNTRTGESWSASFKPNQWNPMNRL